MEHELQRDAWDQWVRGFGRSDESIKDTQIQRIAGRLERLIRGLIRKYHLQPHDADDVVAQTVVDTWRWQSKRREFTEGALIRGIQRIAASKVSHLLRARPGATGPSPLQPEDDPLSAAAREETLNLLKTASCSLQPAEVQLLRLLFVCDCTYRQIADRTGIPLGGIGRRVKASLQRLENALKSVG